MEDEALIGLFQSLYSDLRLEDAFHIKKPLLAHYTTIQVLEKILQTGEVWFSNPLFMNDLEEVRFGIIQGNDLVMQSEEIAKACKTAERATYFRHCFARYFGQFDMQHLLNTYVFCMSEHDPSDSDGLLSMWRGYGANGNGVAIVFDTSQLNVLESSPLTIAAVTYGTTEARLTWLQELLSKFVKILSASDIPNEKLHVAAELSPAISSKNE
jgi:hypothetical protein